MNRTSLLFIVTLLLGGLAYWLLKTDNTATTLAGEDRNFAVDSATVYKIFLADRHENRTTLQRQGKGWIYNERYPARQDAVNNLLDAVHNVQMRFKPADAAVEGMVNSLSTEGIKVELYGKNNNLLKTYYVGGATNDEMGTYMIIEGFNQPYVCSMPTWQGNVRFRYSLVGDDWRDRAVLKAPFDDIEEASVEYPSQRDMSFRVKKEGNSYTVSPFYPLTTAIAAAPVQGKIEGFLEKLGNVQAVRFMNNNPERDSITQKLPFAIIQLKTSDNQMQEVKFWPRYPEASIDPKTGEVVIPEKVSGYFALTGQGDFLVMQSIILDKVFWSYPAFF